MVDGVLTRSQQETANLQADFQELEKRLEDKIEQTLAEKVQDIRLEVSGVRQEMKEVKGLLEALLGKTGTSGVLGATPVREVSLELAKKVTKDGQQVDNEPSQGSYKLKCPSFDGSNFRDWWSKLEQFFLAEEVSEDDMVKVVMLQLEGKALQWHHFVVRNIGGMEKLNWDTYLKLMKDRFAPDGIEDPMGELVTLQQTSSVDQYYADFVSILNQLHLPDDYALSIFIKNLRWEIGQYIRVFQPKDLIDAFRLASHFEQIIFSDPKKGYSSMVKPQSINLPFTPTWPSNFSKLGSSSTAVKSNSGARTFSPSGRNSFPSSSTIPSPKKAFPATSNGPGKLTAAELEEKKRKGLCEVEEFVDCEEKLDVDVQDTSGAEIHVLSLQAMWGSTGYETMRILVTIQKRQLVALIDSGSTHNFLSLGVVKASGLVVEKRHQLKVTIADGSSIHTQGICREVQWESQGHFFHTDFLVLPLKGCDIVLEVQWLASLGSIQWNFSTLNMNFEYSGKMVEWKGLVPGPAQILDNNQGSKMLKGSRVMPGISLLTMSSQLEVKLMNKLLPNDLQQLLDEFKMVFQEPMGLPPSRGHEHRIVLQDDQAVVKIRPYRYPTVQKNEIERHPSLPAKLNKGMDLPTFGSSTRTTSRSKYGSSNGLSYYACSSMSKFSGQANQEKEEPRNGFQSSYCFGEGNEESSNLTKYVETERKGNSNEDSSRSEISKNGCRFHFSIYKWANKGGVPEAISLRGSDKHKGKDKLQRSSSANGWMACGNIAKKPKDKLHNNRFCSIDGRSSSCKSFSLEHDKNENAGSIVDSRNNGEVGQIIEEDNITKSESEIINRLGNTDKNVSKREVSTVGKATHKPQPKHLNSLLDDENSDEQGNDEKRVTSNNMEISATSVKRSPRNSWDNGKARVRGKVKEFIKIFNQDASSRPRTDAALSESLGSSRKERDKVKTEIEPKISMNKKEEKIHQNNMTKKKSYSDIPVANHMCYGVSEKNLNSSVKDTVSDGSKIIVEDPAELFEDNFLVEELTPEEKILPQLGIDPDENKALDDKIQQWSDGKQGNIRSLLSTLQYVLWPGSGWKPVPLVDIIEGPAVKRSYQRALLCLHPDKLQQKGVGSDRRYIAQQVFDILQDAWTHFNSLGS
ncbi:hypothetical protein GQ457_07G026120 [Hibiscus cannabinus]